jgi:hypothetical protein
LHGDANLVVHKALFAITFGVHDGVVDTPSPTRDRGRCMRLVATPCKMIRSTRPYLFARAPKNGTEQSDKGTTKHGKTSANNASVGLDYRPDRCWNWAPGGIRIRCGCCNGGRAVNGRECDAVNRQSFRLISSLELQRKPAARVDLLGKGRQSEEFGKVSTLQ